MTKTDIGGEKMKREDEIENEIQYAYCPERYVTMILTIPAFSLSKLPFRKKQAALKQIKKLKLANKQTDIQAFFVIFAFETAISETAVSKNNIKKKL